MLLQEIKTKIGVAALNLNTSEDAQGNKTDWMTAWIDETRTRVSIHKDTVAAIRKNPNVNLGLQTEDKVAEGTGKPYTFHRIVKFSEAEEVL